MFAREYETPPRAVGVAGPVVLDEAGIISDWELIGGPTIPYQTGLYDHDFGVVSTMPEIHRVRGGVECGGMSTGAGARVFLRNGDLHIDVTPGPNPVEHCAAMGIGFRMTLSQPVGDRLITARLIDPVNQQLFEFPPATQ